MDVKQKKAASTATSSLPSRDKGSDNLRDKQKVFRCLFEEPRTRAQVAYITNIWINSVCYYVGQLFEQNKVKVHHKGECPIKHSKNVEFLTTNPELFPEKKQLTFDFWNGIKLKR
mgnify:CR=1 FL=1